MMQSGSLDVAQVRLDNALILFDEFVQATVKHADAATLRGLERRFAERLQIQPSYWSQIKGRSRQIGERLARQFEQLSKKQTGWMDVPHSAVGGTGATGATGSIGGVEPAAVVIGRTDDGPRDDDERFIVSLVLSYYRRHPQRARTRLLDLLGEVLTPTPETPPEPARGRVVVGKAPIAPKEEAVDLWKRSAAGVAPLKPKR